MADGLYEEWKEGKIGAHQLMALISSYHRGQISGPEAAAIMDHVGLSATARTQIQTLYQRLVNGVIDRSDLDNALMLGDIEAPGFSTKAEFLAKLGL